MCLTVELWQLQLRLLCNFEMVSFTKQFSLKMTPCRHVRNWPDLASLPPIELLTWLPKLGTAFSIKWGCLQMHCQARLQGWMSGHTGSETTLSPPTFYRETWIPCSSLRTGMGHAGLANHFLLCQLSQCMIVSSQEEKCLPKMGQVRWGMFCIPLYTLGYILLLLSESTSVFPPTGKLLGHVDLTLFTYLQHLGKRKKKILAWLTDQALCWTETHMNMFGPHNTPQNWYSCLHT